MSDVSSVIAQRLKFSMKDLFSKCDQICRKLGIWSHLRKKSLIENFIFCAVNLLPLPKGKSSRSQMFFKIGVVKNFTNSTKKKSASESCCNKGLNACNLIKKEHLRRLLLKGQRACQLYSANNLAYDQQKKSPEGVLQRSCPRKRSQYF